MAPISKTMSLALCALSALIIPFAAAQVTTDCNPTNTTKACPNDPAFATDYNFVFNATPPAGTWEAYAGIVKYDNTNGASFTISKQGDSPTIRSRFYVFFGRFEIHMRAAPGQGIISALMLLSDDLDEIDWEFMGSNGTHAETNYFGKGVQDFHNALYYPVSGGTINDYHNYTIDWKSDGLNYYVDGNLVRTLLPAQANNTLYYPQTPMRISLGIWAGGDPRLPEGTRQWAGGDTDYTKGPYTMYIKNAQITDYSKAKEYSFGDATGSFKSIKLVEPDQNSTAQQAINPAASESISQKFNELAPGAKIAVYACSAGVAGLLVFSAMYYIIRSRMRGRAEGKLAEKRQLEERHEMERYKAAGINPDAFAEETPEWDAKTGGTVTHSAMDESQGGYFGNGEKLAVAGAGAAGGVAAAPLLRNNYNDRSRPSTPGHEMPYVDHYSPINGNTMNRPAMPSNGGSYGGNSTPSGSRSVSTPDAPMRRDSPGPGVGSYGQGERRPNPSALGIPQQQRNFSSSAAPSRSGYGGGYQGRSNNWS